MVLNVLLDIPGTGLAVELSQKPVTFRGRQRDHGFSTSYSSGFRVWGLESIHSVGVILRNYHFGLGLAFMIV